MPLWLLDGPKRLRDVEAPGSSMLVPCCLHGGGHSQFLLCRSSWSGTWCTHLPLLAVVLTPQNPTSLHRRCTSGPLGFLRCGAAGWLPRGRECTTSCSTRLTACASESAGTEIKGNVVIQCGLFSRPQAGQPGRIRNCAPGLGNMTFSEFSVC